MRPREARMHDCQGVTRLALLIFRTCVTASRCGFIPGRDLIHVPLDRVCLGLLASFLTRIARCLRRCQAGPTIVFQVDLIRGFGLLRTTSPNPRSSGKALITGGNSRVAEHEDSWSYFERYRRFDCRTCFELAVDTLSRHTVTINPVSRSPVMALRVQK